MSLVRRVFLLTKNPFKLPDFKRSFDRYGIEVIQKEPSADVEALLRSGSPKEIKKGHRVRVLGALREESTLTKYGTSTPAAEEDLERVTITSNLKVFSLDGDVVTEKVYTHDTEGHIDLSKKVPEGTDRSDVFGWDDVFIPRANMTHSLHELRRKGFKYTSRDMCISEYIKDYVYYRKQIDLKWNPQQQTRSVDFRNDVLEFCKSNEFLQNDYAVKFGCSNVWTTVANNGAFFRSAKNRREKTYWLPGLNAGLPYVPKRDALHEITFMMHDFGHFTMPDLIYAGEDTDLHRRVYIAFRMISEAVTMTLADMVFVDSLRRSGYEYDYDKRRIFPLLEDSGLDFTDAPKFQSTVMKLMRANVHYVMRGSDQGYRDMLRPDAPNASENLARFKEKYMPFFVEDFRWTVANYKNISSRGEEAKHWWATVAPLRDVGQMHDLETVGEFTQRILPRLKGGADLVDAVFEEVFTTRLAPVLTTTVAPLPDHVRLQKSFYRYMIGQMAIFARFSFVPYSSEYRDKIGRFLIDNRETMSHEKVENCRSFYEQFVDRLLDHRYISPDDQHTYKEIFPLFEPFYVNYDDSFEKYEDLADLTQEILRPEEDSSRPQGN